MEIPSPHIQYISSSYDMESATLKPPDDILEAATKWCVCVRVMSLLRVSPSLCRESDMTSEVRDIQDSLEDTGVTRLVPIPFSPTSLEAEAERPDILKRPKSLQLMQEDSRPEEKEVSGGHHWFVSILSLLSLSLSLSLSFCSTSRIQVVKTHFSCCRSSRKRVWPPESSC